MACSDSSSDTAVLDWQLVPGKPATTEVIGLSGIAEAAQWLSAALPSLRNALHEHGALYLRGLPITTTEDFAVVRDILISQSTPYREKATPRSDLGNGVFSSTDMPASHPIMLHNENSYTLTFPGLLLFGCLVAPEEGGATPVADCRKVLAALPPRLVDKIRAAGWLLTRNFSDYISTDWWTAFASADPSAPAPDPAPAAGAGVGEDPRSAERGPDGRDNQMRHWVESYCAENLIAYTWLADGNLRTSQLRPGIVSHPSTGEEVWFNHLAFWNEWALDDELRETLIDEFGPDGFPFNTAAGDGEALTREDLAAIRAAYDAATVREAWRPGDLLVVDNVMTAHGRDPFRGARRIVVAMGEPVELAQCKPTVEPAAVFAR
ncbi:TauD/TfdA family dioxygenase [Actinospica sp. MGRD01-02]|uniref:TauD/TfdA family dioxygenase n=1 Tax=Actinospica acidithermotolerans TaxID=2828514 RepID=A0A941IH83_9ACTN|nr:TauD/TfdA family dioxygenase [Actinospica acidithermotolerans]MBR7826934.1 TauD/TfdA family dioxygenase [Actinospica acidithermotolerans]